MGMKETISIGQRIKLAREQKGLTIKELARNAGCLDEYLGWVEDGQVEPPVALLIQVAKALRLDTATFLEVDASPDRRLEEVAKRTEHYSSALM